MTRSPRYVRFHPVDQPREKPWLVIQSTDGSWLLFLHPTGARRRLQPAPPDWARLGPAELTELLARATPSSTVPHQPPERLPLANPSEEKEQESVRTISAALLLEQEKRATLEEQLRESYAVIQELESDLESANRQLRAMEEELRDLAKALPPHTPTKKEPAGSK